MSRSPVRVRYAETDQMGVVYHSNFLQYFEIGRTDYFRRLGFTYKEMEADNVFMPVVECFCKFLVSAEYDDQLEVITDLEMLSRLKIKFHYRVIRPPENTLIAEGYTVHVPVNRHGAPCRIPVPYLSVLKNHKTGTGAIE